PHFHFRFRPYIAGKIETPGLPIPQVDTIISEPVGVLLVHERMVGLAFSWRLLCEIGLISDCLTRCQLESYIFARDRYLRPGGAMFPSGGTVYLAPFTDAGLWSETMAKVRFWEQECFYGVDLSPLAREARREIFSMPVIGNFDPRCLMVPEPSSHHGYHIDFTTVTTDELRSFDVPVSWTVNYTGIVHGIAGWFDVLFEPTPCMEADPVLFPRITLSTSPSQERTHWQQVRLLLPEPLAVNAGQHVRGTVRFRANDQRSYTISAGIELVCGGVAAERRGHTWELQDQTYNYATVPFVTDEEYRPEHHCVYPPADSSGGAQDVQQVSLSHPEPLIVDFMDVPERENAASQISYT
ncbi:MAG: S-adenosyl-L-methionine-dependent methyltransferase, partial [Olpidium bornovanus]